MRRSRAVVALVALALLVPAVGGADGPNPCVGTMTAPADGITVISVQGQRFGDGGPAKKPARIVAVGPRGEIRWVHRNGRKRGVVWSYDIDPLPDGGLFVTATRPKRTVFYELDPRTGRVLWEEELPFVDTHDADLIGRHRILIAHMRNYDEERGRNDDRLLIYNRTSDEVVWEWYFREHYPRDVGGNYTDDWTHVNDVDRIAPGTYLASPRNLDQVIVIDRSSGEITRQLGADDRYGVMREQHNPKYLEAGEGTPTILVADSGNDRIVEYERRDGGWERTWRLTGGFSWPRDADRLPDGNTLIVDSVNHRVLEVTPQGEVVWEVYSPWLVYDAERVALGDEATEAGDLPTVADLGAAGSYRLSGATPKSEAELEACADAIRDARRPGAGGGDPGTTVSPATGTDTRTGDPATDTPGQPGFGVLAALLAGLVALAAAAAGRYMV